MRFFRAWLRRRRQREADWREELESHRLMREQWNRDHGVPPEEASRLANRQFGGFLLTLENVRRVHVWAWWESLLQDCRFALRGFRKSPAFALVAIATIAIGIGASTAVFSVVDRLLFRPLPYPRGERLVSVGFFGPVDTNEFTVVSSFLDWQAMQQPFQSLTAMQPAPQCDLQVGAEPRRVSCYPVTANFLRTLGSAPAAGRDLSPDDDRPGAPTVALLSYPLWRSAFGADPTILNRTVTLDEEQVRVVGILPPDFEMPQLGPPGIILAARIDPRRPRAANSAAFLRAFARLKEGVSVDQAREAMRPLFERSVRLDVPPALRSEARLVVRSLRDRQIHDVRLASWMLLGAVLALLLLACANVGNLLVARAAARRREWAMRAAIGAGRSRLVRQMLTESMLLALPGGLAGCALAWGLVRLFVHLSPDGLARIEQAGIDPRVLAFALATTLAAALLFGLAPALERPRAETLAGWHSAGPPRMFLRRFLVVAQVAISLILLAGASLFLRSFWKLQHQALGFDSHHVHTVSFTLKRRQYNQPSAQASFFDQLESRLKHIPGAGSFALADTVPPRGARGRPYSNIRVVGGEPLAANGGMVLFRFVSPGYFQTMRIPILSGRDFTEQERASGDTPVILSATFARRLFGDSNPLGRQLILDEEGRPSPVVGVVADARNNGITTPPDPEYYRLRMARSGRLGRTAVAIFRTSLPPATLTRWIRAEVASLDATLPLTFETLEERVSRFRERPRFLTALLAGFAAAGLLLAAIGLYGVLSFLVAQQTREIGVRMALGSRPRDIAYRILRQAALWLAAGALVGVAGSLALARTVRGLLFDISPADPLALFVPIAVLCAVGALAAWIPARRAAAVDPVVALRCQ